MEVKNYVTGEVEEELYADSKVIPANTKDPVKVADGKIEDGYEGIAVSLACTQNANVCAFLKIAGKQVYPNGLNTAGLGGLSEETLLLVKIEEGKSWELGFNNTGTSDVTVAFRFRIRKFRKK
jgi:hypothetical protein